MITGETLPDCGYEALSVDPLEMQRPMHAADNDAYHRYIAMHKVIVGQKGASLLLGLVPQLEGTQTPGHLVAAGWAATEAALILGSSDGAVSELLLGVARGAWTKAIAHQRWINAQDDHPLADQGLEFRSAVDIAFLPLFSELATGQARNRTLRGVYADVLNIAQAAGVRAHLAEASGTKRMIGELRGVRHEMNGLLAYNRRRSGEWFMIPALSRADNGIYHREQTHDMMAIHQSNRSIVNVVPIEMKAHASKPQRRRYASLLIRGKMHLSIPGKEHPEQVLEALTADYEGTATKADKVLVQNASQKVYRMVGDYLRGEPREERVGRHGPVWFRDKSHVTKRHPGLAT